MKYLDIIKNKVSVIKSCVGLVCKDTGLVPINIEELDADNTQISEITCS